MKPHYFDQDEPDQDDNLLHIAKEMWHVPKSCLLGGKWCGHFSSLK